MCLGVPGEILACHPGPGGLRYGTVRFGAADREVCLAYVPEAKVGDFVIVHVGLALTVLSREDAEETFSYLEEMEQLSELGREADALEREEVP
ncbi:MAG TPA: HypC/HybG/HupF family hydrogenase formation chaperone [Gemmatimonadales bacterium]|nr:HypC/HybG/HupF family hydrogenase formation chaperone [Gemmatimonadales bacterium]